MKKYDPTKDIALVIANSRKKVRPNTLIEIAEALERLVTHYGSMTEAGKRVDLSAEMVREFLTVLKLPLEVRELIAERKIDKIDIVRKIAALEDPAQQNTAAVALSSLTSDEVRDVLRLVNTAGVSIEEAKRIVMEAKPKGFHIFMMDFDDEEYKGILLASKKLNIKPAELVRNIVRSWLKDRESK